MKITKRQLRRIIREEKARIIEAYQPDSMELEFAQKSLGSIQAILQEFKTGMFMAMDPDRITGIVDDQLVADIKAIMELAEALQQKIYDQG